jgi:hypothetical protein
MQPNVVNATLINNIRVYSLRISGFKVLSALSLMVSLGVVSLPAKADDWGCKVVLCLSNPGGPTQFAECRPPIEKLWKHLRKGRPFPTCSGSDFTTSRPVHDPYRCGDGLELVQDDSGVVCRSAERSEASANCNSESPSGFEGRASSAQFVVEGGQYICRDYAYAAAIANEKPRYVDVRMGNGNTTRVRF